MVAKGVKVLCYKKVYGVKAEKFTPWGQLFSYD